MEALQADGMEKSILRRIWRYKFHYIVVLPAMALILFFKVLPFLLGLRIPFTNYSIFKGIWSSPWVGLDHFRRLLYDPVLRTVLANTLILKLSYIAVCFLLSVILALALSSIRSRLVRNMFSTLFLVPYFIPSAVIAYIMKRLFLAGEDWFRVLAVMAEALKTCGIPMLLALAAIRASGAAAIASAGASAPELKADILRHRLIPAARAALAFVLLQTSTLLSTDFELVHSLQNPTNLRVSETLDTFQYRTGFLMMNLSQSSALGLMQYAVQLLLTFAAYLLARSFFRRDLFTGVQEKDVPFLPGSRKSGTVGWLAAALFGVLILSGLFYLFIYPFTAGSSQGLGVRDILSPGSMLLYGLLYFAAAIGFVLITITLAYPLTVMDLPGRRLYKGFLLMLTALGAGKIHEYLFVRTAGMAGTIFPPVFLGLFSFAAIFVLKGIFNSRYAGLKAEAVKAGKGELNLFFMLFIPKLWKPIVGLGILQFTALWNSYHTSLLYMSKPQNMSPAMLFWQSAFRTTARQAESLSDPVILQTAAVVSIVPVVLFLAFRPFLTSETLISQLRK